MRGGETSRHDFMVRGEILSAQSGGVSFFEEGFHIIATDGDPTTSDIMDGFKIRNKY